MYLPLRQGQIQKSEQDGKSLLLHFPHHIGLMISHSASLGQFWFWCQVQTNCDISDILKILYGFVCCLYEYRTSNYLNNEDQNKRDVEENEENPKKYTASENAHNLKYEC